MKTYKNLKTRYNRFLKSHFKVMLLTGLSLLFIFSAIFKEYPSAGNDFVVQLLLLLLYFFIVMPALFQNIDKGAEQYMKDRRLVKYACMTIVPAFVLGVALLVAIIWLSRI